ncbi:MAG: amino acid racemase [Clostridia bacterium]|nr:amino acid racemase [Clostridia bacterium]
MKNMTLGILGGLGPMSGVLFCEMLIRHTAASADQEHLNFILSSRADTPDRTAFILGSSSEDPTPAMIAEVKKLSAAGADIIAIPCNTAHFFYESVRQASDVPIINIIRQTVELCRQTGTRRVGVFSTEGTARSGAYESVLREAGIEYIPCTLEEQKIINEVIYENIKKGAIPDTKDFLSAADALRKRGCQRIILGCTELSVFKEKTDLGEGFVDSLEVLALSAIRLCGKEPRGFSKELMNFIPRKEDVYVTE